MSAVPKSSACILLRPKQIRPNFVVQPPISRVKYCRKVYCRTSAAVWKNTSHALCFLNSWLSKTYHTCADCPWCNYPLSWCFVSPAEKLLTCCQYELLTVSSIIFIGWIYLIFFFFCRICPLGAILVEPCDVWLSCLVQWCVLLVTGGKYGTCEILPEMVDGWQNDLPIKTVDRMICPSKSQLVDRMICRLLPTCSEWSVGSPRWLIPWEGCVRISGPA